MSRTIVDVQVKEDNGKHLITVDKLKNVPVNQAIEILKIKYSTKGLFKKICKGFDIMAKDLDDVLYKNARNR